MRASHAARHPVQQGEDNNVAENPRGNNRDSSRGSNDISISKPQSGAGADLAAAGQTGCGSSPFGSLKVKEDSDALQLDHTGLRPQQISRVGAALEAAPWLRRIRLQGEWQGAGAGAGVVCQPGG